jgi:hypothetical protein
MIESGIIIVNAKKEELHDQLLNEIAEGDISCTAMYSSENHIADSIGDQKLRRFVQLGLIFAASDGSYHAVHHNGTSEQIGATRQEAITHLMND